MGAITLGSAVFGVAYPMFYMLNGYGLQPLYFSVGVSLAIASLSFSVARRYARKATSYTHLPFVLGLLMALPHILQVLLNPQLDIDRSQPMFFLTIVVAAEFAAYLGIARGLKMREELLKKVSEQS